MLTSREDRFANYRKAQTGAPGQTNTYGVLQGRTSNSTTPNQTDTENKYKPINNGMSFPMGSRTNARHVLGNVHEMGHSTNNSNYGFGNTSQQNTQPGQQQSKAINTSSSILAGAPSSVQATAGHQPGYQTNRPSNLPAPTQTSNMAPPSRSRTAAVAAPQPVMSDPYAVQSTMMTYPGSPQDFIDSQSGGSQSKGGFQEQAAPSNMAMYAPLRVDRMGRPRNAFQGSIDDYR